ncbi:MAG: poly-gamma-glutamate synthase PgsB [Candidatus Eisenbacteria bacterium]
MAVLLLMLALVLVLWGHEAIRHRRALRALEIRIHVNGTRGKSSVTRLLAGALREANIPTFAKTTGSTARLIFPDGHEEPIVRVGSPNICEQIGVLDQARRSGARAIVMECMAVRPDLQKVCEHSIMKSSIGVCTNVRPDHLDVMGPTVDDVAVALSSTVPKRATAVLGDARFRSVYRKVAAARRSELIVSGPSDLPPGAMDGFRYVEHEENVATALAVTRRLHIPDETALRGMYRATPDVGACTRWTLERSGRPIEFVNIFAANDLESTIQIWRMLGLQSLPEETTFALINLRGDRVDRSLQYAAAVEGGLRADFYVLVGDFPDTVLQQFRRQVPEERLVPIGREVPQAIFDRIASLSDRRARVGGVGNIGGLGHEILRYVAQEGGPTC